MQSKTAFLLFVVITSHASLLHSSSAATQTRPQVTIDKKSNMVDLTSHETLQSSRAYTALAIISPLPLIATACAIAFNPSATARNPSNKNFYLPTAAGVTVSLGLVYYTYKASQKKNKHAQDDKKLSARVNAELITSVVDKSNSTAVTTEVYAILDRLEQAKAAAKPQPAPSPITAPLITHPTPPTTTTTPPAASVTTVSPAVPPTSHSSATITVAAPPAKTGAPAKTPAPAKAAAPTTNPTPPPAAIFTPAPAKAATPAPTLPPYVERTHFPSTKYPAIMIYIEAGTNLPSIRYINGIHVYGIPLGEINKQLLETTLHVDDTVAAYQGLINHLITRAIKTHVTGKTLNKLETQSVRYFELLAYPIGITITISHADGIIVTANYLKDSGNPLVLTPQDEKAINEKLRGIKFYTSGNYFDCILKVNKVVAEVIAAKSSAAQPLPSSAASASSASAPSSSSSASLSSTPAPAKEASTTTPSTVASSSSSATPSVASGPSPAPAKQSYATSKSFKSTKYSKITIHLLGANLNYLPRITYSAAGNNIYGIDLATLNTKLMASNPQTDNEAIHQMRTNGLITQAIKDEIERLRKVEIPLAAHSVRYFELSEGVIITVDSNYKLTASLIPGEATSLNADDITSLNTELEVSQKNISGIMKTSDFLNIIEKELQNFLINKRKSALVTATPASSSAPAKSASPAKKVIKSSALIPFKNLSSLQVFKPKSASNVIFRVGTDSGNYIITVEAHPGKNPPEAYLKRIQELLDARINPNITNKSTWNLYADELNNIIIETAPAIPADMSSAATTSSASSSSSSSVPAKAAAAASSSPVKKENDWIETPFKDLDILGAVNSFFPGIRFIIVKNDDKKYRITTKTDDLASRPATPDYVQHIQDLLNTHINPTLRDNSTWKSSLEQLHNIQKTESPAVPADASSSTSLRSTPVSVATPSAASSAALDSSASAASMSSPTSSPLSAPVSLAASEASVSSASASASSASVNDPMSTPVSAVSSAQSNSSASAELTNGSTPAL